MANGTNDQVHGKRRTHTNKIPQKGTTVNMSENLYIQNSGLNYIFLLFAQHKIIQHGPKWISEKHHWLLLKTARQYEKNMKSST